MAKLPRAPLQLDLQRNTAARLVEQVADGYAGEAGRNETERGQRAVPPTNGGIGEEDAVSDLVRGLVQR